MATSVVHQDPSSVQSTSPSGRRKALRAVRRAWKQADRQGTVHHLPADLDAVNAELALAAAQDLAERIAAERPPIDFEALLDRAERLGWEGDDLAIPEGLGAFEAALFAETWADGRRQRAEDEAELAGRETERGTW